MVVYGLVFVLKCWDWVNPLPPLLRQNPNFNQKRFCCAPQNSFVKFQVSQLKIQDQIRERYEGHWKICERVNALRQLRNYFHMTERTHVPRHAFANIYSHRFLNVSQPWPGPWSGQPLPPSSPPPSRHSEPDYCKLNMWRELWARRCEIANCELDTVRQLQAHKLSSQDALLSPHCHNGKVRRNATIFNQLFPFSGCWWGPIAGSDMVSWSEKVDALLVDFSSEESTLQPKSPQNDRFSEEYQL